jgi:hypothetical protein
MKSTSFHRLNADRKLGRYQGIGWLVLNWLNNVRPVFFPHRIPILSFRADVSDSDWCQIDAKSSPSRKLGDLFWLKLPWQEIHAELGEIHVVDTGCGAGAYAGKLQNYSGGRIASYTGLDASYHEHWITLAQANPTFSFHQSDFSQILDWVPTRANFFITQSAIEHFEEDLLFFEKIREFLLRSREPAYQVHLFPSPACLHLYLWHGVRQYSPRAVGTIAALFRDFSEVILFRLGGTRCNTLHWQTITKPRFFGSGVELRETDTEEYDLRLRKAVVADLGNPSGSPSFYALVVHSFGQRSVLPGLGR